jgi:hypothetical protein
MDAREIQLAQAANVAVVCVVWPPEKYEGKESSPLTATRRSARLVVRGPWGRCIDRKRSPAAEPSLANAAGFDYAFVP